jgi:ribonuclease G
MREIFIERRDKILRIAIKDNNRLSDCFMEEESNEAFPGQIYNGIVKNVLPGIKSAFIDIGLDKNAYMYIDRKLGNINIKKGDEIIVEVVKEELGGKGATVTNKFTIAGRYSVVTTANKNINISSKIKDEDLKRALLDKISKPDDIGLTIRTNACEAEFSSINEEISRLYQLYKGIITEGSYRRKPGLLYSDEGVLDRMLRDNISKNTKRIIVDSCEDYNHVLDFLKNRLEIPVKPELYNEHRTLFDFYGIEKELLNLRNNRVGLSCGGYIVIDKTEAMYVIDVNSGKNVGNDNLSKTVEVTNLQAAAEIPLQVRLRNLSGIIIIDFIDITSDAIKEKIINTLKKGFEDDKNKTIIYPFTELNLVQIARRRRGKTIYDYMEEECVECKGKGRRLRLDYIKLLLKNEILRADAESKIKDIYIQLDEAYKTTVEKSIGEFVKDIGGEEKRLYLKFAENIEYFKLEPLIFESQVKKVENYKIYG